MTYEEFIEIFDTVDSNWDGDGVLQGALLISKYIDMKTTNIIRGVSHGIIYSIDVTELIDAGITKEDVVKLCKLNWMVDSNYDCLACYV